MNVDEVRLRCEAIIPDLLEHHRPGHDLAGPPHEVFEQLALARQQVERARATAPCPGNEIEFQAADPQNRLAHIGRTTQQGFDPGGQLAKDEGFGQVVVAAGP